MLTALVVACAVSASSPEAPPAKAPRNDMFALVFHTGPAWDPAKAPGEQAFFADHSKNLRDLKAEGRIALGGRFSDVGLVLVRADSLADAQGLVDRDPSVKNGTFRAEVHPFYAFMPGCVGMETPR